MFKTHSRLQTLCAGIWSVPILVWAACATFAQQKPEIAFPVDVVRARIDVRVVRKHTAESLAGLSATDFTIRENGRETIVKSAGRDSIPLDLILMLDVSDSMNRVADELLQSANDLAAAFSPQDRVAVVEFAVSPIVRAGFTSDASQIKEAIRQARDDVGKLPGSTATYDAITEAVNLFKGPPGTGRRRAVLVGTDDIDIQSHNTTRDVVTALLEKDAVLNAVVLKNPLPV
jgi:uncharacterized protein with von Willebrand factor type A (vWA) domain